MTNLYEKKMAKIKDIRSILPGESEQKAKKNNNKINNHKMNHYLCDIADIRLRSLTTVSPFKSIHGTNCDYIWQWG